MRSNNNDDDEYDYFYSSSSSSSEEEIDFREKRVLLKSQLYDLVSNKDLSAQSIEIIKSLCTEHKFLLDSRDAEGRPLLSSAIFYGHTDLVKYLLTLSINIHDAWTTNKNDYMQQTALGLAILKGNLEIVKLLIEKDADISATQDSVVSPVHLAAEFGQLEILKYLLNANENLINTIDKKNETPLVKAAKNGYLEVVNYLIQLNANPAPAPSRSKYIPATSALVWAGLHGYYNIVSEMINHPEVCKYENPIYIKLLKFCLQPYDHDVSDKVNIVCDLNGNNPLHLLLMKPITLNELDNFLKNYRIEEFITMTKMHTNEGALPYDILNNVQSNNPELMMMQERISSLLTLGMTKQIIKNLTEKTETPNFSDLYNVQSNEVLYQHLLVGYEALSYTESIINQSYTHPEFNTLPFPELKKLKDKTMEMRKLIEGKNLSLEEKTEIIKRYKIGNCGEYSILVYYYLTTHYPDLSVQICKLKNSEHLFVVAGKNPDLSVDDTTRIIIDGWSKIAKPYSSDQVHCYTNYTVSGEHFVNATSFFNPKCHEIQPYDTDRYIWKGTQNNSHVNTHSNVNPSTLFHHSGTQSQLTNTTSNIYKK